MLAIRKPIDTSSLPHSGLVDIMADITEKEEPWAARAEQIFEELQLQAALNQTSLNSDNSIMTINKVNIFPVANVNKNAPGYFPEYEGEPKRQLKAQAAFAAGLRQGRMEALAEAKAEMEHYNSMNMDGMKNEQKAGLMELSNRLEENADRLARELGL